MPTNAQQPRILSAEANDRAATGAIALDAMYNEWMMLLARDQQTDDGLLPAEFARLEQLARAICATPAEHRYHVDYKVRVLEDCLEHDARNGTHGDNRAIAMLAGIKADLLRSL